MIVYLFKMTLCASFFLLVYHFFFEKERMHRFKRFYLLVSLVVSILIPFIEIEVKTDVPVFYKHVVLFENYIHYQDVVVSDGITGTQNNSVAVSPIESLNKNSITIENWIFFLYVLACVILLIRFSVNINRLIISTRKGHKLYYQGVKLILIEKEIVPHSFLSYIFLCRKDFENESIKHEVILHELTHVRQKHSFDIIFLEILSILFWFNPIVYLYKNKIKLNHEFLADENVITNCGDVAHYQLILLDEMNKINKLSLASNFNYLITKKRLIMMTKITSKKRFLCKGCTIVPLLVIAISVFSTTMVEKGDKLAGSSVEFVQLADEIIIPESGVSQEVLDEYKRITDKYMRFDDGVKVEWNSMNLSDEDRSWLYVSYVKMTKEQRKLIYIRFNGPLNPFKLRSPNKDEWRACIRPQNKIWLDGKEVNGADLNSYNQRNIVFFVYTWAKKDGEISKVHLWTKKGHGEYLAKYKAGISESDLLKIRPMTLFSLGKNIK